jgi:hypothetical protein
MSARPVFRHDAVIKKDAMKAALDFGRTAFRAFIWLGLSVGYLE